MITTDKEAVLKTGLAIKKLALQGIDGERNAAENRLHFFMEKFGITLAEINEFEINISTGYRIVYLKNIFYNGDELIDYLKTKNFKEQAAAFFSILIQLIQKRFFNKN
ncbi:MAG TPA: hypothetical protein VK835_02670 [Bacteroidia bacterium]|jgi:hypothetical protein|nr:hypothetical protein [Bacteroidia bacterium]